MEKNLRITRTVLSILFCISGFCALLYQTIWLRLAFAEFGVITPVVSSVIATFMLGLGLGSWVGGLYVSFLKRLFNGSALILYGIIELLIGLGAFMVPRLFHYGAALWTSVGETNSWTYLLSSALVIAISILPFAIAMGMTYPAILEFLREYESNKQEPRRFGFLYAANTAGACLGAITTVFVLIELLGFRRTLIFGAFGNFLIALIAIVWGIKLGKLAKPIQSSVSDSQSSSKCKNPLRSLIILFFTGFCSMAMEVVWIRSFAPLLGQVVYSFASLLTIYLFSNWFGAFLYRLNLQRKKVMTQDNLIALCALCSTIPLLASNPAFFRSFFAPGANFLIVIELVALSIVPFSVVLGYLTPLIIDELSLGDPKEAGKAYAVNIMGCIVGPLLAGYLILPLMGARISLILLTLPLVAITVVGIKPAEQKIRLIMLAASFVVLFEAFFWFSWEEGGMLRLKKINAVINNTATHNVVTHRDYAATTLSLETDNNEKLLLVNGQPMTSISRVTKFMAHLPLAVHKDPAKSMLIICFGMGTTFRSALTWPDCKVTVIELVPGVRDAFGYYYPDAKTICSNTNGRIVIDDGRRFLRRTAEKFDVIIVDPPPPLASASSGLLYSREFFELVKKHLNPEGILQEWFGFVSEPECMDAVLKSLKQEFRYVCMYHCIKDPHVWGWHFLASDSPMNLPTSEQFYARLPDKAKNDLMEPLAIDNGKYELNEQIRELVSSERTLDILPEKVTMTTDDYPFNEYCLLRKLNGKSVYLKF